MVGLVRLLAPGCWIIMATKKKVESQPEALLMHLQKARVAKAAERKEKAKEKVKARRARAIGRARNQANRRHGLSVGAATTEIRLGISL